MLWWTGNNCRDGNYEHEGIKNSDSSPNKDADSLKSPCQSDVNNSIKKDWLRMGGLLCHWTEGGPWWRLTSWHGNDIHSTDPLCWESTVGLSSQSLVMWFSVFCLLFAWTWSRVVGCFRRLNSKRSWNVMLTWSVVMCIAPVSPFSMRLKMNSR